MEGKVSVKASSLIVPDNVIFINSDYLKQKIIVKQLTYKRESYAKAKALYIVLEEENSELKEYFEKRLIKTRPTKQERRDLISLKNSSNYLLNS